MTLRVKVVSKEIIKPSSPTPDHLRHYRFSSLDQTSTANMYCYLILFFESKGKTKPNMAEISKVLKQSLADVLTLYYPLAGTFHDNLYVDCNDRGIPFLKAHVTNCKLSDVLLCNSIPADQLTKLVPFELEDAVNNIPFGVQLNVFACGGFAIGQCVSHKIADGTSMLMFSKAWAAAARRALGDDKAEIQPPEFVAGTLFPPKLFPKTPRLGLAKEEQGTRRFVFDASNIEQLRAKHVDIQRPTRIEALSTFIWSRLVAITENKKDDHRHKLHNVFHVVNLRARFDPPLPLHCYGNLITLAESNPLLSNTRDGYCHGLAGLIRKGIRSIDRGYIKKLQQEGDDYDIIKSGDGVVTSVFTSLCNYPAYDNDFGWGRPSWAPLGLPKLDCNNLIIFSDAKDSTGIEVSITATEPVLTKLERDNEFLKRICPRLIPSRDSNYSLSRKPTPTPTPNINTRSRVRMFNTRVSSSIKLFGLAKKVIRKI